MKDYEGAYKRSQEALAAAHKYITKLEGEGSMNAYTIITEHMYVCNDCGAFADTPSQVNHLKDCEPKSNKWKIKQDQRKARGE